MIAGKFKAIEFAYPSSTNAKKYGFENVGCYIVDTIDGKTIPQVLGAFATVAEAEKFAEGIDLPFHRFSLRAGGGRQG